MLEELLTVSDRLNDETTTLIRLKQAFVGVQAEAEARIQNVLNDTSANGLAYRLMGEQRWRADAMQMADTRRKQIQPALDVQTYKTERLHMQVDDYERRFEREAQEPPDAETATRQYFNGIGLSIDQSLLTRLLDQITVSNVRAELATATPTRRVQMYKAASETPHEPVSASVIRLIESAPPYPANVADSSDERQASAELGRLITQTRQSRIPPEVARVREVLDKARHAVASAKSLGATPINPEHQPHVAAAAKAVAQELAAVAE